MRLTTKQLDVIEQAVTDGGNFYDHGIDHDVALALVAMARESVLLREYSDATKVFAELAALREQVKTLQDTNDTRHSLTPLADQEQKQKRLAAQRVRKAIAKQDQRIKGAVCRFCSWSIDEAEECIGDAHITCMRSAAKQRALKQASRD